MNTVTRLGAYVAGLAVVFGGALGVGNAVGEVVPEPAKPVHQEGHTSATPATTETPETTAAAHGDDHETAAKDDTPGGLQVSEGGYTLNPLTTLKAGEPADFRFTVTGADGKPVTDYQVEHDKKMHFIVVSRDLGTFRHLHPEMAADGTWSVKLELSAGAYRAFADFVPTGGSGLTLGTDLLVAGDYTPKALPKASRSAEVDGYTVSVAGDLVPGQSSELTLSVSKDGKPVTDLEPYLGAYGHLVALRAGDLAYLHVHPEESTTAGPDITFYAEVPSSGDYRLFLDFQHDGEVRTADFTATAGVGRPRPSTAPSASHGDDHTH